MIQVFYPTEGILHGSLAPERDLARVVRFLVCQVYQNFGYFLAMAGDDDGLQVLSIRIGTVEEEISAIKSILDSVIQELKRLSLKIDDQSMANGT